MRPQTSECRELAAVWGFFPWPARKEHVMPATSMEELVSLCKRRGFIFQGSEIYGGLQGFYDYGPLGVELKNNIKAAWWRTNAASASSQPFVDTSRRR